jgi:hypothetical protein
MKEIIITLIVSAVVGRCFIYYIDKRYGKGENNDPTNRN